eukprot:COSAG02_NODE_11382_length_1735_cov_1.017726_1_plen_280_part_10
MRLLAFEVASQRLGRGGVHGPKNLRSVWDSLELETACVGQQTRPPARPTAPAGLPGSVPAAALFVDYANGHDGNSGTVASPLKTVEFALQQSIATTATPRPIVLRNGTHQLRTTLNIGPSHSGLQLSAYPGEHVVLSGGVELNLEFSPAVLNSGSALVATLPSTLSRQVYTELFVSDKNGNPLNLHGLSRYTKARWPDGNPETDAGMCTTINGCKAYSTAVGSCGSVPFVNGTWIEIGPSQSTPRRSSWNAVDGCPTTSNTSVFGEDGRCAMGKCCAGYC